MLRHRLGPTPHATVLALLTFACASDEKAEDSVVPNASFDDWCDRNLCDWRTAQGRVEPSSTWHRGDLGASLEETPTEIWQHLKYTAATAPCLLFETIADVAPEADVSILIDFNDDGIQDEEQRISAVRWKSVPFPVRAPVAYDGLRLTVIKRGEGRAVLALMRVIPRQSCSAPLTLADNSKCSEDAVCRSGRCVDGRCTSLTPAASSE